MQKWKASGDELLPVEWGWKESDGGLTLVYTDLSPAPDELLQCSLACGNCKGSGCMNSDQVTDV